MLPLFEQNRLGWYDPILLGSLCNVDAVTLHEDYARFMRLGMRAFVMPPGEDHKQFVDSQTTVEDKVLALSFFTLFAHENRHFWDFITTPAGLGLAHAALDLQYDFLAILPQLASQEALYFPFTEWVRSRGALVELSPALLVIPPEVEAFAAKVERYLRTRSQWEHGGHAASGSPSSTQIIEALAFLVQGEAVRRYFGEDARTLFYEATRAGETGRWYLGAVDYLRSRLPELDMDGQALLLQMALYGSLELPASQGSPAAVLPYLVEQFEKTRPRFPDSYVEQAVLCDGYLSLLQNFGPPVSFRNAGRALFDQMNATGITANDPGSSALNDLLHYLSSIVNLGSRIVQRILFAGNVGNLRITHQLDGLYRVPSSTPFFESSQGMVASAQVAAGLQSLVGSVIAPGRNPVLDEVSADFAAMVRPFPDDEPVSLLYMFTPKGEHVPDYMALSWKLFPQMFLCNMAIVGVPQADSLGSVLLSEFLSGYGPALYGRNRRLDQV